MAFYDAFDRPSPPPPAGRPVVAVDPGRASRYAARALQSEVDQLARARAGTRNDTLNRAGYSLAQLVAGGHLDRDTVRQALTEAGRASGLDDNEIRQTLRSSFQAGAQHPRQVPELPQQDGPPLAAFGEDFGEHQDDQLAWQVNRERIRRQARRIIDQEEAAAEFREPPYLPTLTDELAIPDEPVRYTIDQVMPRGANVLLTAQYKTGKTTLINNLARALVDDTPFLDRFKTQLDDGGRVALWNYEVDARQYRTWLRDLAIVNTDRISVLNLRGFRMPVAVRWVEDWAVDWLTRHQVAVWVVDPFARAYLGASENDNAEVGRFLDTLDVIKARAGVTDLIVPTHTGRGEMEEGQERARGATRLDDWTDVRWLLTKDKADVRYFRATGRDVELPEEALTFDQATRQLRLGGGDRAWAHRRRVEDAVVAAVQSAPGVGMRDLRLAVRELVSARNETIDAATTAARFAGRIRVEHGSGRVPARHWPADVTVIE